MKLIPLFSLLFCAFGLLAAPVTALADTYEVPSFNFVSFAQSGSITPSIFSSNLRTPYSAVLTQTDVDLSSDSSTSGSLGSQTVSGSVSGSTVGSVGMNVDTSTVPPQWSIQNNVDFAGSLRPLDSSSAGPGYWWSAAYLSASELGVASATRNETTSGTVSGSSSGTIDASVSGSLGSQSVSTSTDGTVAGSEQGLSYEVRFVNLTSALAANPRVSFIWTGLSGILPEGATFSVVSATSAFFSFYDEANHFFATPEHQNIYVIGRSTSGEVFVISPSSDGLYRAPADLNGVALSVYIPDLSSYSGRKMCIVNTPRLYVMDASNEDVITSIEESTQEQTDTLMNTDGSDSIVSGATSGGEEGLLDKLGFIGTVVQVPLSILDGLTSAEESTITFPGISVPLPGGNFVIPMTEIDLWENFPALETPVRTGCTFVCVLLWLNGCKSLYDRIVHGDQDVIIEEGSA